MQQDIISNNQLTMSQNLQVPMVETRSDVHVMRAVATPSTNSGAPQMAWVGGTGKVWEDGKCS